MYNNKMWKWKWKTEEGIKEGINIIIKWKMKDIISFSIFMYIVLYYYDRTTILKVEDWTDEEELPGSGWEGCWVERMRREHSEEFIV